MGGIHTVAKSMVDFRFFHMYCVGYRGRLLIPLTHWIIRVFPKFTPPGCVMLRKFFCILQLLIADDVSASLRAEAFLDHQTESAVTAGKPVELIVEFDARRSNAMPRICGAKRG